MILAKHRALVPIQGRLTGVAGRRYVNQSSYQLQHLHILGQNQTNQPPDSCLANVAISRCMNAFPVRRCQVLKQESKLRPRYPVAGDIVRLRRFFLIFRSDRRPRARVPDRNLNGKGESDCRESTSERGQRNASAACAPSDWRENRRSMARPRVGWDAPRRWHHL